jgi:hypothetical protein
MLRPCRRCHRPEFEVYAAAIRDLASLKPGPIGPVAAQEPAGSDLTPEKHAAESDRMERPWQTYLDLVVYLATHQFGGGTGGPSFGMQTYIRLVRSHM